MLSTERRQFITVDFDGTSHKIKQDSGVPCEIVNKAKLRDIKPHYTLNDTDRQFMIYTHHRLKYITYLPVNVTLGNTTRKFNLYAVDGDYDTLFERKWIAQFVHKIDFKNYLQLSSGSKTATATVPLISNDI